MNTTITSKDLNYLKDILNWQMISAKKCFEFAQTVSEPEIKQVITKNGQMHQRHYETLLKFLA